MLLVRLKTILIVINIGSYVHAGVVNTPPSRIVAADSRGKLQPIVHPFRGPRIEDILDKSSKGSLFVTFPCRASSIDICNTRCVLRDNSLRGNCDEGACICVKNLGERSYRPPARTAGFKYKTDCSSMEKRNKCLGHCIGLKRGLKGVCEGTLCQCVKESSTLSREVEESPARIRSWSSPRSPSRSPLRSPSRSPSRSSSRSPSRSHSRSPSRSTSRNPSRSSSRSSSRRSTSRSPSLSSSKKSVKSPSRSRNGKSSPTSRGSSSSGRTPQKKQKSVVPSPSPSTKRKSPAHSRAGNKRQQDDEYSLPTDKNNLSKAGRVEDDTYEQPAGKYKTPIGSPAPINKASGERKDPYKMDRGGGGEEEEDDDTVGPEALRRGNRDRDAYNDDFQDRQGGIKENGAKPSGQKSQAPTPARKGTGFEPNSMLDKDTQKGSKNLPGKGSRYEEAEDFDPYESLNKDTLKKPNQNIIDDRMTERPNASSGNGGLPQGRYEEEEDPYDEAYGRQNQNVLMNHQPERNRDQDFHQGYSGPDRGYQNQMTNQQYNDDDDDEGMMMSNMQRGRGNMQSMVGPTNGYRY